MKPGWSSHGMYSPDVADGLGMESFAGHAPLTGNAIGGP
jgi:hypothetical protein